MSQRSTRADVARQAGVSKTTVTYVLGDRLDIAIPETTRERVRRAARQLGYHPHAAAQALRSGRTNAVAVAFPINISAHGAHVLQAMERQTNAHGFHMVATTVGHVGLQNVEPDLIALRNSLTDGLILIDMPAAFRPHIQKVISGIDKPVVSAGVFTVPGTDCIEVDLDQGARDAFTHLLAARPERVAFFGPGGRSKENVLDTFAAQGELDPRLAAYHQAMQEAGRPLEIIAGSPESRSASMDALREYVAEKGCPDALFCFNDEMAIAASRALREMGKRIPEDVLLVGCDGSMEGEYMNPALSTIVQPLDAMCVEAWKLMAERLSNSSGSNGASNALPPPPHRIQLRAEFVSRDSSRREEA